MSSALIVFTVTAVDRQYRIPKFWNNQWKINHSKHHKKVETMKKWKSPVIIDKVFWILKGRKQFAFYEISNAS